MSKRYFSIVVGVAAILELDSAVIDVVDDEWRQYLYDLHTPEEIAEMVGRMMIQGHSLSSLDGWADQPDENARLLVGPEWDEALVRELKKGWVAEFLKEIGIEEEV